MALQKRLIPIAILLFIALYIAMIPLLQQSVNVISSDINIKISETHLIMPEDSELYLDIDVALSPHAVMKHSTDANLARQCSSRNDAIKFYNPSTRRTAFICDINGVFGIQIVDELQREVTAFLKNKMKNFGQVTQYMRNAGYELLH